MKRTTPTPILYEKYIPMICNRVSFYSKLHGFDNINELYSNANLIFAKAVQQYIPEKGTRFGSYLWIRLQELQNNPAITYRDRFSSIEDLSEGGVVQEPTQERYLLFTESLALLSPIAKKALTTILHAEANAEIPVNGRIQRDKRLQYFLAKQRGWEWSVASSAIQEVKKMLREM